MIGLVDEFVGLEYLTGKENSEEVASRTLSAAL
jgi:hypothetical protein